MANSVLEVETQELQVWNCEMAECNAWTRVEFVTEATPPCPLCKSPMVRGTKHVQITAQKGSRKFFVGKRRF
ncbi:cold-inducible protein YdjO-related protein [Paenibacillus cremeus]|uniref:Cold-shock protein n=1 Tax=Paenibacillus cremeus TaxID=2163881 RepID=A0A559KIC0_9BACL|nr:cold-shock protein [Paenibacillus cremeus]